MLDPKTVDLLIQLFERNEFLYNPKHTDYGKSELKEKLWTAISTALNTSEVTGKAFCQKLYSFYIYILF